MTEPRTPEFDPADPFGLAAIPADVREQYGVGTRPEAPVVEGTWDADAYDLLRQEVLGGARVDECDPQVVRAARRHARKNGLSLRFRR